MFVIIFRTAYVKLKNNTNAVDCDSEQPDLLKKEVCIFEIDTLGSVCTAKNDYGYKDGTPCVLLKVNKVRFISTNPFGHLVQYLLFLV